MEQQVVEASGLKATLFTPPACLSNWCNLRFRAVSRTCTVPSSPPQASVCPSAL